MTPWYFIVWLLCRSKYCYQVHRPLRSRRKGRRGNNFFLCRWEDGKGKANRFGAHTVHINRQRPCRMNEKHRRDDVFLLSGLSAESEKNKRSSALSASLRWIIIIFSPTRRASRHCPWERQLVFAMIIEIFRCGLDSVKNNQYKIVANRLFMGRRIPKPRNSACTMIVISK